MNHREWKKYVKSETPWYRKIFGWEKNMLGEGYVKWPFCWKCFGRHGDCGCPW